MASESDVEALDDEIRELLQNYKFKKATVYEPCTIENYKECLIGLHEEFQMLNLNYVFNPYCDVTREMLHPEALIKLINAVWTLLHYYKSNAEKAKNLVEENHVLTFKNKHLNAAVDKLKEKVNSEKNEARACVASAQRISDHSDEIVRSLAECRAKLAQQTKQKETMEKCLRTEISRLKSDNEKLTDRLRNKSGSFTPCSQTCDFTIQQLKERIKKQQAMITKLQSNGQELIKVLAMKENII